MALDSGAESGIPKQAAVEAFRPTCGPITGLYYGVESSECAVESGAEAGRLAAKLVGDEGCAEARACYLGIITMCAVKGAGVDATAYTIRRAPSGGLDRDGG